MRTPLHHLWRMVRCSGIELIQQTPGILEVTLRNNHNDDATGMVLYHLKCLHVGASLFPLFLWKKPRSKLTQDHTSTRQQSLDLNYDRTSSQFLDLIYHSEDPGYGSHLSFFRSIKWNSLCIRSKSLNWAQGPWTTSASQKSFAVFWSVWCGPITGKLYSTIDAIIMVLLTTSNKNIN
jgi:hypothetical protein